MTQRKIVHPIKVQQKQPKQVVVIGAGPSAVQRVLGRDVEVLSFPTIEEFERWRASTRQHSLNIHGEVTTALGELGYEQKALSAPIRKTLSRLAHYSYVPKFQELGDGEVPRRSLYRAWKTELHETPARFLARVRALHAQRLICESGISLKEAALAAGYPSSQQLRKVLGRRRNRANAPEDRQGA